MGLRPLGLGLDSRALLVTLRVPQQRDQRQEGGYKRIRCGQIQLLNIAILFQEAARLSKASLFM